MNRGALMFSRRTFLRAAAVGAGLRPLCAEGERRFITSAPLTHSDWMLRPGALWGEEGVRRMLEACRDCGWSRIYWRVFDGGRALHRSRLLRPQGKWDSDNFWNPAAEEDRRLVESYTPGMDWSARARLLQRLESLDYSEFDSLRAAVDHGHELGLEVHAWATINEDDHGWGLQSEFSRQHPEFRWRRRDGRAYRSQLSFAFPEVRQYKLRLLEELLDYEIDGLLLDWIRTGDVRDNPQTDADGTLDAGHEEPLRTTLRERHGVDPADVAPDDERWVRIRAEPQTEFMRGVRRLLEERSRRMPVAALVGHPWLYRGLNNPIAGNLRGLFLDVEAWAREGLADALVPAGYYRSGGSPEEAVRALRRETGGAAAAWTYEWVPHNSAEAGQAFERAAALEVPQILFWEADYIDDRPDPSAVKAALRRGAGRPSSRWGGFLKQPPR